MSILGIRVTPSKITCAHLDDNNLSIFCYETPAVFTYKQKVRRMNATKYHTAECISYFVEIVNNLVKQLSISGIMIKKTESSTFRQSGITDSARQHLYLEGALLSLGATSSIPCNGCYYQEHSCVGIDLFDTDLKNVVNQLNLNCNDLATYGNDKHAGEAAFSAYIMREM